LSELVEFGEVAGEHAVSASDPCAVVERSRVRRQPRSRLRWEQGHRLDSGTVFAGTEPVAVSEDSEQARFVRAVLTIDPAQTVVDVADGSTLTQVITGWTADINLWWKEFVAARLLVVEQITDDRVNASVTIRALELSHASEIPSNTIAVTFAPKVTQRSPRRRK
jgi:hypothetical protein